MLIQGLLAHSRQRDRGLALGHRPGSLAAHALRREQGDQERAAIAARTAACVFVVALAPRPSSSGSRWSPRAAWIMLPFGARSASPARSLHLPPVRAAYRPFAGEAIAFVCMGACVIGAALLQSAGISAATWLDGDRGCGLYGVDADGAPLPRPRRRSGCAAAARSPRSCCSGSSAGAATRSRGARWPAAGDGRRRRCSRGSCPLSSGYAHRPSGPPALQPDDVDRSPPTRWPSSSAASLRPSERAALIVPVLAWSALAAAVLIALELRLAVGTGGEPRGVSLEAGASSGPSQAAGRWRAPASGWPRSCRPARAGAETCTWSRSRERRASATRCWTRPARAGRPPAGGGRRHRDRPRRTGRGGLGGDRGRAARAALRGSRRQSLRRHDAEAAAGARARWPAAAALGAESRPGRAAASPVYLDRLAAAAEPLALALDRSRARRSGWPRRPQPTRRWPSRRRAPGRRWPSPRAAVILPDSPRR